MTQTSQDIPSAAPTRPATRPGIVVPGPNGTSRQYSTTDVMALRARAKELGQQMTAAESRREEVQAALGGASGADRARLEARLGVLDARIARMESDIDETNTQLASLDVAREGVTNSPPHWGPDTGNRLRDNEMPLAVMFILFVLTPVSLALSRTIWRRGSRPSIAPATLDTTQRLERMEQAMDAIAVEIERVSEGQRFVTRLMSEGDHLLRRPQGTGSPPADSRS